MRYLKINKYLFTIFFIILCSLSCTADSPLTSILFWAISNNSVVQSTGSCSKGKKILTNQRLNLILNQEIDIFHKLALVNALGWEFNGKCEKNSKVFLEELKKQNALILKNSLTNDFEITHNHNGESSLGNINIIQGRFCVRQSKSIINTYSRLTGSNSNDLYLVYLYLAAMDNYWDVSLIYEEFNKVYYEFDSKFNKGVELDTEESFKFVKMLVSSQYSLIQKGVSFDVWEQFDSYLLQGGKSNVFIKRTLPICNSYLSSYKKK
jgi:hypothetical protein